MRLSICFMLVVVLASSAARAQRTWKQVERFTYDWNRRGQPLTFVFEMSGNHDGAGEADRLTIASAKRPLLVIDGPDGFEVYRKALRFEPRPLRKARTQRAKSRFAVFLPYSEGRELLFVMGPGYASSPGSLRVIVLDQTGVPRILFYEKEMDFVDLADLDGDGAPEFVGRPCYGQTFGPDGSFVTYDPLQVFKILGDKLELSVRLSKRYNLSHGYVWAGPECSEKVAVAERNGRKILVDPETGKRLKQVKEMQAK